MGGMPTHAAPRRDFRGLEVRRQRAARLFAAGRETQGATASQTRQRAERGRHPALDHHALARGKKNARRRRAWIVFQDESGVSQRPPVRRTWAPRGETPVLIHAFNWKKLSVAIAVAFRWDRRRSGLIFQTQPGSYNDVALIGFFNELRRHL